MTGRGPGADDAAGGVVQLHPPECEAVRGEAQQLIRCYGGMGRPSDLVEMAATLDSAADKIEVGGRTLHLWARALRAEADRQAGRRA